MTVKKMIYINMNLKMIVTINAQKILILMKLKNFFVYCHQIMNIILMKVILLILQSQKINMNVIKIIIYMIFAIFKILKMMQIY